MSSIPLHCNPVDTVDLFALPAWVQRERDARGEINDEEFERIRGGLSRD